MTSPTHVYPPPASDPAAPALPAELARPTVGARLGEGTHHAQLPPGPLTTAELAAEIPVSADRARYHRIWHGMYRREDQVDDLRLRSVALARTWPEGVLRGRSAALLWGDDSAPTDALPEIWLPATRRSREGRVYRYGALPAAAVTELAGLRVTTPLRTCRDLACDLDLESAVVAVERLCAAVPGLAEQLRAAVEHPSGRGVRGGRRFAEVVGVVEPRSGSVESTRARLALSGAGLHGFAEGHQVRINGRSVPLPLADPVARCAVVTAGGRAGAGGGIGGVGGERTRAALRRAGWTIVVVRGPDMGGTAGTAGTAATTGTAGTAGAATGEGTGEEPGAHEVLRARWPGTQVLPPQCADAAADPLGLWSGRRA